MAVKQLAEHAIKGTYPRLIQFNTKLDIPKALYTDEVHKENERDKSLFKEALSTFHGSAPNIFKRTEPLIKWDW